MRIGIAAAKARLAELVKLAAGGEVITLTRNGKPVAVMVTAGYADFLADNPGWSNTAKLDAEMALQARIDASTTASTSAPEKAPPVAQDQAGRPGLTLAEITRAMR